LVDTDKQKSHLPNQVAEEDDDIEDIFSNTLEKNLVQSEMIENNNENNALVESVPAQIEN
jgi:hypothetical protein